MCSWPTFLLQIAFFLTLWARVGRTVGTSYLVIYRVRRTRCSKYSSTLQHGCVDVWLFFFLTITEPNIQFFIPHYYNILIKWKKILKSIKWHRFFKIMWITLPVALWAQVEGILRLGKSGFKGLNLSKKCTYNYA